MAWHHYAVGPRLADSSLPKWEEGVKLPTTLETQDRPVPPDHRLPAAQSEQQPPVRRRSFWWVWLLIALAAAYGLYRWYETKQVAAQTAQKQQAAKAANRAVPVVAAAVHRGDMPVYLRGLGTVTAFNTVTVKSRVDGQLTEVAFKEGQFVKQGELLAQIDPRAFQVQADQALGQQARDQAQLKDAQVNLARDQALWEGQVIAKQQLDTQGASVGQFKGTLTADQAAIDNAKLQLTYARITAPISGRIGLRLVDVGNIVHAADANGLVVIAQIQPIAILFTIPADNLPPVLKKLRAGVKLEVDAYDRDDVNKIAQGYLLTLDNTIDQTTGTARMKAVFTNADSSLFPNQFVNCRLLLDTKRGALIAPVAAVQRGPQGSFVYVVGADKKADVRNVTAGLTEGNDVEIVSGLQPGEVVVTDGQDRLQAGSAVDVRATGAGKPANKSPRGSIKGKTPAGQTFVPGQAPPSNVSNNPNNTATRRPAGGTSH